MLIGSCFTENIGTLLQQYKFPVDMNPFGIVYNPAAVAAQLERLINPQEYAENDLVCRDEVWYSFDHHGRFSATDPRECLDQINSSLQQASSFIRKAGHLILTFGTARVYRLKQTGQIVANCHRFPEPDFDHRLYEPDELLEFMVPAIDSVIQANPGISLIWSISPVRYLKEGSPGNQLAKANLIRMVAGLLHQYPHSYYFPAYEMFMDDLRDYRFYANDMVHAGEAGIAYVWDLFRETCIDSPSAELMNRIEPLVLAARHRPTDRHSTAHEAFVKKQLLRIGEIIRDHPWLDFEAEIKLLKAGGSDLP